MASNLKVGVGARNAAIDAVLALGGGSGGGDGCNLKLYTGPPPDGVDDPPTGTLLMGFGFDAPAYGSAANGAAELLAPLMDEMFVDGDAGWFRLETNLGVSIYQGTCGDAGDAPVDLEFDNKGLLIGGHVTIVTLTLTMP